MSLSLMVGFCASLGIGDGCEGLAADLDRTGKTVEADFGEAILVSGDPTGSGEGWFEVGKTFAGCSVAVGVVDIQDWSSGDGFVGGDLGHFLMTFAASFLSVGPGMGE